MTIMLTSSIKLPERENLTRLALRSPPSFPTGQPKDWLPVSSRVRVPDPVSSGRGSWVTWPLMWEEKPRVSAERNGGQAHLFPPEEALGGAGT